MTGAARPSGGVSAQRALPTPLGGGHAPSSTPVTVGVLGGGQLGRMLALAGLPLGVRFRFLDPSPQACAGQVGELIVGDYRDPDALARFAADLDLVTYEFENVDPFAAEWLSRRVSVHPGLPSLLASRDRVEERRLFERVGFTTPRSAPVDDDASLAHAVEQVGTPAVLKSRLGGYDGKGQALVRVPEDAPGAWAALGRRPAILDAFIAFDREVSLVGVRGRDGTTAFYPIVQNHHGDGMLRRTLAPASGIGEDIADRLRAQAAALASALGHVGVFAIEFFESCGAFYANEWAPRVHNSGHWTMDGAVTSQFENHLRAICGWPLGCCDARGPTLMINLVGSIPPLGPLLATPGARVHLYGKEARPGRKVGHVNIVAPDEASLLERESCLLRQVEA